MPELFRTYVVMDSGLRSLPVEVTPTFWQEIDEKFDQFRGRVLIAAFSFEGDWPTWEIHPAGDEVVVLLSGSATMLLGEGAGQRAAVLSKAGEFVIVPKGTWHTAKISQPTAMLFITPGEGTENRPIDTPS